VNDFAEIRTKITLEGVGGMVRMQATGAIPNDKGILVVDTDATIDHFEFSGAAGASGNAAGIRYQGGALTVTNSYFHDNQNGLLANPSASGTITIRDSEFAHNGSGDGYTHNLYVGDIAKLSVQDSYFHDAVVGHQIKSRAEVTEISNTRIFDNSGSSSYSIDLPNGGRATLTGNVIEQGPNGGNPNIVAFGEEGGLHAGSALTLSGNTVINDMGRGTFVWDASGTGASISDTRVFGLSDSQMASGSGVSVSGTTYLAAEPALDTSHPWTAATSPTPDPAPSPTPTPDPTPAPTETAGVIWTGTAHADVKTGTPGDDNLSGLRGNDLLKGGAGDDTLAGGRGNDTLVGGAGDDRLIGGSGDDLFRFGPGGGHDTVQGFATHAYTGGEHDHFDLSGLGITAQQFAAAVHIADTAAGALISVGDSSMTVLGMHASSFNSSDFIFG
jgi:Ca2+-binding RTX toxin-like protein